MPVSHDTALPHAHISGRQVPHRQNSDSLEQAKGGAAEPFGTGTLPCCTCLGPYPRASISPLWGVGPPQRQVHVDGPGEGKHCHHRAFPHLEPGPAKLLRLPCPRCRWQHCITSHVLKVPRSWGAQNCLENHLTAPGQAGSISVRP